jgi:hypothetical protein
MKFAPLVEKIATVSNEAQLRSCFINYAGELMGATAWGLDFLLPSRSKSIEKDIITKKGRKK